MLSARQGSAYNQMQLKHKETGKNLVKPKNTRTSEFVRSVLHIVRRLGGNKNYPAYGVHEIILNLPPLVLHVACVVCAAKLKEGKLLAEVQKYEKAHKHEIESFCNLTTAASFFSGFFCFFVFINVGR